MTHLQIPDSVKRIYNLKLCFLRLRSFFNSYRQARLERTNPILLKVSMGTQKLPLSALPRPLLPLISVNGEVFPVAKSKLDEEDSLALFILI